MTLRCLSTLVQIIALNKTVLCALCAVSTHTFLSGLFNVVAKELHLAPQIVLQTPSDKLLYRLFPLTTVGYVQHAGL